MMIMILMMIMTVMLVFMMMMMPVMLRMTASIEFGIHDVSFRRLMKADMRILL